MKNAFLTKFLILVVLCSGLLPPQSLYAMQDEPGCQTEVAPLVYEDILGQPVGSVGRLLVAIEPNPQEKLRLAFFESEVTAAGPLWRIAGWSAVMYASLLLAVDPDAYRITFDIEGSIDGPSAGALTTVALLACLLGDPIQPHMTMTGTLHPDGSVGPVGSVYYKLQGAAEAGLKIVFIPKGQRLEQVDALEEEVDLIAYGRELGVTVREVGTIFEAYKALTRRELPQPIAASSPSDQARLPAAEINQRLLLLTNAALQLYRIQHQRLAELSSPMRRQFASEIRTAEATFARASQALENQNGPVAYDQSWRSLLELELVQRLAHVEMLKSEALKSERDAKAIFNYLDELITDANYYYGRFLDKLNGRAPMQQLDAVTYADAHQMVAPGTGLLMSFFSEANGNAPEEDARPPVDEFQETLEIASWLVPAITNARFAYMAAHEILNAYALESAHEAYSPHALRSMDEIIGNFAETNLEFLSYLVDDTNEELSTDQLYQNMLSSVDGRYFLENEFLRLNTESARLGLNMRIFVDSTLLLTKYYVLDFAEDDKGKLTAASAMVLEQMVQSARTRAVQAMSFEQLPVAHATALYHFALAEAMRADDDLARRLQTLGHYWQAALEAELLNWMSGEYDSSMAQAFARSDRNAMLWQLGRMRPPQALDRMAALHTVVPALNDEFASSDSRQNLFEDEDGALFVQRDRLHVRVTNANQLIWYHTDGAFADFWAEVDVAHVAGDLYNGAGLIFGYQDDNNFYEFLVGVDGYYQLSQIADGEWSELVEWTRSDAIQVGERTVNQIGLLVDEDAVTLIANGIVLERLSNVEIPHGELLLVAETLDSEKAEFAFDNLRVRLLEPAQEDDLSDGIKNRE